MRTNLQLFFAGALFVACGQVANVASDASTTGDVGVPSDGSLAEASQGDSGGLDASGTIETGVDASSDASGSGDATVDSSSTSDANTDAPLVDAALDAASDGSIVDGGLLDGGGSVVGGPPVGVNGYTLKWSDEFTGNTLNTLNWGHRLGLRNDALVVADAVTVQNDLMTITTYTDSNIHYTGYISTQGKYEPTYGYYEARIRYHSTPGELGAFWLQSQTIGVPVGDPATAGVEVDIVEHRVRNTFGTDVSGVYGMALHWDGYGVDHKTVSAVASPPLSPVQDNFHIYSVLWTPDRYTFYVDGIERWTTTAAISKRSQSIRLSCEVRAASFLGEIPPGGYGAKAASVTKMDVDWVRVWQP